MKAIWYGYVQMFRESEHQRKKKREQNVGERVSAAVLLGMVFQPGKLPDMLESFNVLSEEYGLGAAVISLSFSHNFSANCTNIIWFHVSHLSKPVKLRRYSLFKNTERNVAQINYYRKKCFANWVRTGSAHSIVLVIHWRWRAALTEVSPCVCVHPRVCGTADARWKLLCGEPWHINSEIKVH